MTSGLKRALSFAAVGIGACCAGLRADDITKYDKNFVIESFEGRDLKFYPAADPVFTLSGLYQCKNGTPFSRMPLDVAQTVSDGVYGLATHTSGGILRFRTNSKIVALKADLYNSFDMNHMPRTGSSGFDCLVLQDGVWRQTAIAAPCPGATCLSNKLFSDNTAKMREFLVNFPLYGGVSSVSVGLEPDAKIEPVKTLKYPGTILFYGSSITQGGCADRGGNAYPNMLSRNLGCKIVNLGFSGNACGEQTMAEYIANQEITVFVMDYDWNAHSLAELKETHNKFFRTIRKAQPNLPIVIVSRPDVYPGDKDAKERRKIIERTWQTAKNAGDRNVYYVNGETFFEKVPRNICMVDGCHPNTLGFYQMTLKLEPLLRSILDKAPKRMPSRKSVASPYRRPVNQTHK